MRRRADDWINATHILKAAGFDKPARTRILEREVQKGVHEKVQGGYGKYQGALSTYYGIANLAIQPCTYRNSLLTCFFQQEPGSRFMMAVVWRREIRSWTRSSPSSTMSPELRVLRRRRNMRLRHPQDRVVLVRLPPLGGKLQQQVCFHSPCPWSGERRPSVCAIQSGPLLSVYTNTNISGGGSVPSK